VGSLYQRPHKRRQRLGLTHTMGQFALIPLRLAHPPAGKCLVLCSRNRSRIDNMHLHIARPHTLDDDSVHPRDLV
jgi:hypothetical protein